MFCSIWSGSTLFAKVSLLIQSDLEFNGHVNTIKGMSSWSVHIFPWQAWSSKLLTQYFVYILLPVTDNCNFLIKHKVGNDCKNYFMINLYLSYVAELRFELVTSGTAVRCTFDYATEPDSQFCRSREKIM